jgi:hypothetical protein
MRISRMDDENERQCESERGYESEREYESESDRSEREYESESDRSERGYEKRNGCESDRKYESESDSDESEAYAFHEKDMYDMVRRYFEEWFPDSDDEIPANRETDETSERYFEKEIQRALFSGDVSRVLELGKNFDLNADKEYSFLMRSITGRDRNSDTRVTEALLSLGARPTGKDLGMTAYAVYYDDAHKKFLHLLLRAGANVNEPFIEQGRYTTPFRVSLGINDYYAKNLFMLYGGRISSHDDIREMVMNGNTELLDRVVKDGWDPLVRHNGLTHLEALCYNTSGLYWMASTVIRWLGRKGASFKQRTPEGGPLISYLLYQYAIREEQLEVFEWFMDHGAAETADWEDRYGDSPLSIAVASNAEMIVRLLARGVKPDSGNAMKKATGEVEYHPESLRLIRPDGPVSKRTLSILRGEKVYGPEKKTSPISMNYR